MQEWSGARMEVEPSVLSSGLGHEGGEHKFNLLVKYIVRPSIAKEFIGEVMKVWLFPLLCAVCKLYLGCQAVFGRSKPSTAATLMSIVLNSGLSHAALICHEHRCNVHI